MHNHHWLLDVMARYFPDPKYQVEINKLESYVHKVPYLEDPVRMTHAPVSIQPLKPYLFIMTTGQPMIGMMQPLMPDYWMSFHYIPELSFMINKANVKLTSVRPLDYTLSDLRCYPQYQNLGMMAVNAIAPLTPMQAQMVDAEEKVKQMFEEIVLNDSMSKHHIKPL